jgi:hypothetical protein
MVDYILISISKSFKPAKKLMAIFENKTTKRRKTVHFGAAGMSDYTIHRDWRRKARYIARHQAREDWENFLSAGSLSRYVIWNKKSLESSILDYRRRFNL